MLQSEFVKARNRFGEPDRFYHDPDIRAASFTEFRSDNCQGKRFQTCSNAKPPGCMTMNQPLKKFKGVCARWAQKHSQSWFSLCYEIDLFLIVRFRKLLLSHEKN
uniref:Uncharacterized protein n=1 Tax=Cryptomonas curvata TaxID=233186 RepID=A0A7S0ME43_9CRYP|mmetsp:Transcript_32787/g.68552  ORF Transcript_32787/g.68552 Transcript_32787/m.68552 type:complete len:105 (+) Transcript_32787:32-346(+)